MKSSRQAINQVSASVISDFTERRISMYQGIIEILLTLGVIAAFVLGVVYGDQTIKMAALGAILMAWKGLPVFNPNRKETDNEKGTDSSLT